MDADEIQNRILVANLKKKLEWYEDEIRKRGKAFIAIFNELRNDPSKPWRVSHESYEAYCLEVWGMSPRRLQQLAAGESLKALMLESAPDLSKVIQAMPEGQLRELAAVPELKRTDVLREAVKLEPKLTAKTIKKAKARVIDAETGKPDPEPQLEAKETCPACGQELP